MKKPPNPLVWILLSVGAFVVGGGLCVLQFGRMADQAVQLAALRQSLKDENKIRRQLKETEQQLAVSQAQLRHLELGVPEMAYIPTLLTEVEVIGRRNGILVTGVRPKAEPKPPRRKSSEDKGGDDKEKKPKAPAYQQMTVEITGTGTYAAVLQFLRSVERFPKIVAIQRLNLSPKREARTADSDQLEMTAEFRLFAFPPTPAAKDDEAERDLKTTRRETDSDENG